MQTQAPGVSPCRPSARYIHHIDTHANVNFLLPLGDLLLGTLRRELTAAELARWPSYEEARKVVQTAQ